jgi:hypothetical protein
MSTREVHLSARAICVLEMMAEGHSYAQIIDHYPDLTYPDIFHAASEALEALTSAKTFKRPPPADSATARTIESSKAWARRLAIIKSHHPRAYERWTADEEERMATLYKSGCKPAAIAKQLQRQPRAIRSRLHRIGLTDDGQLVQLDRQPQSPE